MMGCSWPEAMARGVILTPEQPPASVSVILSCHLSLWETAESPPIIPWGKTGTPLADTQSCQQACEKCRVTEAPSVTDCIPKVGPGSLLWAGPWVPWQQQSQ
jgi:hypothetical protein